MKIAGPNRKRRLQWVAAMTAVMALFVLTGAVPSWAAGAGGEWRASDWYRVLNFVVLALLLYLLLRKPAGQFFSNRIKGIARELEELEARKTAVEKQLADYNSRLATLENEAEQIVAEYIQQGEEAKARILKEAESAADKLKEQARKNIEYEFNQARSALQAQVVEKALAKAEQIIAKEISAADQNRLVDEYLEKVVV